MTHLQLTLSIAFFTMFFIGSCVGAATVLLLYKSGDLK